MFISTTVKYVNKTVEVLKARSPDSLKDDLSILEELLLHRMAPNDVITMVIDLLMAGVDTVSHHITSSLAVGIIKSLLTLQSSNTTAFLLYFLAKNPDKQEILRQEILSTVGPKGSPISSNAFNDLPYLKACIKESLRSVIAVILKMNNETKFHLILLDLCRLLTQTLVSPIRISSSLDTIFLKG